MSLGLFVWIAHTLGYECLQYSIKSDDSFLLDRHQGYIAKDPRGWIHISESHWEVAGESREGFSPSGILTTPGMQDSLIWIQSLGVFHINPTPGS